MAVRCRQVEDDDLDAVVAILCRGFSDRSPEYWRGGLARHRERVLPPGYPVYGYLLEAEGRVVGVLLTLHTMVLDSDGPKVRCNLSSWYVEPAFRGYGGMLDKIASRPKDVTYLNVTPAPHTWPILEARGYRRYCEGQMLLLPALCRPRSGQCVQAVGSGDDLGGLKVEERDLVRDHIAYGCAAFLCVDRDGTRPLLFQSRRIGLIPNTKAWGQVPAMQLIYARDIDDLARFAGAIGRVLLRRFHTPLVVVDAERRISGVVGRFFPGRAPKYKRGTAEVRLGDLTYTELVLFGP